MSSISEEDLPVEPTGADPVRDPDVGRPDGATDPESGPSEPKGVPRPRRFRLLAALVSVTVVVWLLDQATKFIALEQLRAGSPVDVLDGFLRLTLVYNSGAAFGLAAGYTLGLTLLACGVVVFVVVLARRLESVPWAVAFGLLLGGALGNLTDRMFREPGPLRGYVVDFIQLPHWPVFNLADSAISVAAVLIVFMSLTGRHLDGTRDGHGR